jgi:L-threonylcarbamoyladenylate synthase
MNDALPLAIDAIRTGKLVGLPTETVYGIAADALNPDAVAAIFRLKQRPADNPLIVHLAHADDVVRVATAFPDAARRLAERFWPGPLTLVLPKRPEVPDITSGGLDTVAVRIPNHPVAHALIAATGPLAAPSANRFMRLSPTRASDIDPEIAAGLAVILDGGPCEVGIESTVVDATDNKIRLLRPGGVSAAQLAEIVELSTEPTAERRSPGLYPRHYAPRARLILKPELAPDDAGLTFDQPTNERQILMPKAPGKYAAQLYAALHDFDRLNPAIIVVQSPPETPEWSPVWDRLRRAATELPNA